MTDASYQMVSIDGRSSITASHSRASTTCVGSTISAGKTRRTYRSNLTMDFRYRGPRCQAADNCRRMSGTRAYSVNTGTRGTFRTGLNFFPFKNKVVRWNNELLYLYKSPVGYTSVAYPVAYGMGF